MARPNFFEHLHPPTIPAREARFTYTFGLGGMSLFLFLSLIVTGVLLMFVYVPTAVSAADSIRTITYVAPFGWLLRNLHYWAAVLLLLTSAFHLLRVVFSGSYKPPRRFNWLLGLALLLLSLLLSFSGYVLRWDVDTFGALTVGTNIVRQFPLLGGWFYGLLVGGPDISVVTVVRFYTWHTLGLSVPVLLLMGWHAFRVRRDGGISHQSLVVSPQSPARPPRISRRELVQREGVAMLALLSVLFALSLFFNAPLAAPVDPLAGPSAASTDIAAPWFFLWIQALLRRLPPLWAGILIPLGVTAVLALLPWTLDRKTEGTAVWFHPAGRWAQVVVIALTIGIIALTLLELWR
ncbi:MAG: cytochrome b N-terminal domain-containing protein [Anaerolineae bacterium]